MLEQQALNICRNNRQKPLAKGAGNSVVDQGNKLSILPFNLAVPY